MPGTEVLLSVNCYYYSDDDGDDDEETVTNQSKEKQPQLTAAVFQLD